MAFLLILLAILSIVNAAPNTVSKREAEPVEVTVVTKKRYDPSMVYTHLEVLRTMISDYAKTKGVTYDMNMLKEATKNENGKFAAVYTVLGSDCENVSNFARGAKSNVRFVTHLILKCGDKPTFQIA